jgi:hypothetical protein
MKCFDCLEVISEYVDGVLELGAQTKIERHLADCDTCRGVRDDLLQIVHFSSQLPMQAPSRDLWVGIKTQIEAERPKTVLARLTAWWTRLHSRDFNFTVPRMAAVAATLIVVALIGLAVLKNATGNQIDPGQVDPLGHKPIVQVPDIQPLEQRINELKDVVEQKKKAWDADLRLSFERSMVSVEDSLNESRREFTNNPEDEDCRALLFNAYREKVRILEGFANF